MVRMFNPTRVVVVWDGVGGAQNRKNVDEHYKANRAHASVIHYDIYEDKKAELSSMQDQADRLQDYLSCLPVSYIKIGIIIVIVSQFKFVFLSFGENTGRESNTIPSL